MCRWKGRYTSGQVKMINKTKTSKGVSKENGSQQPVQRSVRKGSQTTSKPQTDTGTESKAPLPALCLLHPVQAQAAAMRNKECFFPVWSFSKPWKHHRCLRGAADLDRNPSNQIMAVASM